MSAVDLLRSVAALGFVLGLIGLGVWAIRRGGYSFLGAVTRSDAPRRVKVIEATSLDARRKLVLVHCDDRDHLILLSPTGETVVQSSEAAPT